MGPPGRGVRGLGDSGLHPPERRHRLCTASFQATHRLTDPFGSQLWTLGGTYRFDLVRSDGAWMISAVVMTVTWADGNRNLMSLAAGNE